MWQRTVPLIVPKLLGDSRLPLSIRIPQQPPIQLGDNPEVEVKINSFRGLLALLFPSMGRFAQCYVQGDIDLDGELLQIIAMGEALSEHSTRLGRFIKRLPHLPHRPGPTGAEQVQHHYDASNEFYALWLDRQMVYSGAYFRTPGDSLEQAQQQKLEHIFRKLRLQPGERLLDIGCGWGALLFNAVKHHGVTALGITLSPKQYDYVAAEIERRGIGDRCQVKLCDYRELPSDQPFDKIASVGMIEHVGQANIGTYFRQIHRLLAPGGLVLIQGITIGRLHNSSQSGSLSRFMERYVFPGSQLLPAHQVAEQMQQAQLECIDQETLRLHYAQTLKHWAARLDAHHQQAIELVGEQRYRIWRIYMAGCAYAFERGWISLHQLLAGKLDNSHWMQAPWTREDIYQPDNGAMVNDATDRDRRYVG
ncbi:class I SAM-dependent methyltransferase [Marinobacterium arenosum]|uniref:class I SAM-dependent methyltransferase n=1 Tax=Marinobacterium arenosum TaxID=2862496 RepID=UPI001C954442|nr:class I SAM-dependent methyltransferase [Marinobacterium arenosum]MBY4676999.1 class I SAM-dependent methyltransferase [Marinobacterium arenosum]